MGLITIGKLFNFEKGVLQSSKCIPGPFNFITASSDWKTHNEFTHDCEALIFAAAASGSLGRTHYVHGKFVTSDLCFIITPKDPINLPIDIKFYHIIFNELKNDIVKNTKAGTSKEAIGLKSFGAYRLPYFDIDQQILIRNKFDLLKNINENIKSELTHQLDLIKKLRQQLLQDSIQGKLVPQNPDDEPASVLLQKIKTEKEKLIKEKKLKKEKKLPPIKPEEIPFEIPENWVWCRLGEIASYSEAGKSYKGIEVPANNGQIGVIKTSAITSGIFLQNENKLLPNQQINIDKIKIEKDDIIFCRASGSKGLIGKSCLVSRAPSAKLILSDKSIRFVFPTSISKEFIQVYNSTTFVENYYIGLRTGKSTSMNNVTREQFNNLLVPVAPIFEQRRIVQRLDELMKASYELEASIKQSQQQNEQLLQQVLREALTEKVGVN